MSASASASPAWIRPLRPRDPEEAHRTATPLELFTDLCFVVAIAQAAATLHHLVSQDHLAQGLGGFAIAFFAIWWAWLNFGWFASAYDNDDLANRLLAGAQIVGSLVLAAGIPRMFDGNFTLGVAGYVIMRLVLVVQWVRVARHDPPRRTTATRYAVGIVVAQSCWVALLWFPEGLRLPGILVFVILDMAVPSVAERAEPTPWHPHHITERYGLFYIIVLGETVLSTTVAIQEALDGDRFHAGVGYVVGGGLLIVFSAWWLYFSRDHGEAMSRIRGRYTADMFVFGFGHYFVFASGAAVGAGLAARVDHWTGNTEASGLTSALLVTVPTALLLVSVWVVCQRPHDAGLRTWAPFAAAALLVLGGSWTPAPEAVAGAVCALLVAVEARYAAAYGRPAPQPARGAPR